MMTTRTSLLERIRDHSNEQAWVEFHALYHDLITRYAQSRGLRTNDAEDVASDCMNILVNKLSEFEYNRKRGRFRNYLRQIVINRIAELQRRKRVDVVQGYDPQYLGADEPAPDRVWDDKWKRVHIDHALQLLRKRISPKQFEVFQLYMIQEWPVRQVMDHCNVTANQVYLARTRGMAQLREILQELLGVDAL